MNADLYATAPWFNVERITKERDGWYRVEGRWKESGSYEAMSVARLTWPGFDFSGMRLEDRPC